MNIFGTSASSRQFCLNLLASMHLQTPDAGSKPALRMGAVV